MVLVTGDVLINDCEEADDCHGEDDDEIELRVTGFTQPTNGSLVSNGASTFTYTPEADYNGVDTFTYTIVNDDGCSATGTVTITVIPASGNNAPDADNQSVVIDEDVSSIITLTASDIESNPLTYSVVTGPANGTLSGTVPNLTYSPNLNYNGSDSFTFVANDGQGDSQIATVNIAVTPVNDTPVAVDDSVISDEDTPVTTVSVLANDIDVDGDTLIISSYTQPANGTLIANTDNTFTYSPVLNFNGSDSFTYTIVDGNGGSAAATISIAINPVNDAPAADSGADQNVLVRDHVILDGTGSSDIDGDSLTWIWALTAKPVNSIAVLDDPSLPTPSFTADEPGSYEFNLLVKDGSLDSSLDNVIVNAELRSATVPDTTGFTQADAEALIQDTYLQVGTVSFAHSDIVSQGNIISQEPSAGTTVLERTSVNLVVSYDRPTIMVTVDPVEVVNGQTAVITWSTTNADSMTIDNGIGEVTVEGIIEVSPVETTTYTLYAVGLTGSDTKTVTVTVLNPPFAVLTADKNIIRPGDPVVLSWLVTGSDAAVLEPGFGEVPLNGKITVLPNETTIYVVSAEGISGNAISKVTVEVTEKPIVSITTSDARIYPNELITLFWTVSGADTCTLEPGIGVVDCNSSIQLSPLETTVYALTATGLGGVETEVQEIEVIYPFVSAGDSWKYLDNGTDQGTAWEEVAYDDSTWASGPAKLGYGESDLATVASYGNSSSNKFVTTYFRKNFWVEDAAVIKILFIEFLKDDGGVVFLNGVEILRANIPSAEINYVSLAINSPDDGKLFRSAIIDSSLLVSGNNVLAVEIHQSSVSSSDLSFDCQVTGMTTPAPFVSRGSVWRYLDNGSGQGTAWHEQSFDDSSWQSGQAQLGYGESDEATTISYGSSSSNKYITTYFRKTFTVSDQQQYNSHDLELKRDDGAVVYINGVEVARSNIPEINADYQTLSLSCSDDGNNYHKTKVDPSFLVVGNNIIVVELHQDSRTSSDTSFDLKLSGSHEPMPLIPLGATWKYLDNGSDQSTAWFDPAYDDRNWKSGMAQLGYGESDEASTVSYGPDSNNKYVTTYFRKTITVSDPLQYKSLDLELQRDDGAVVYINGVEVVRSNIPATLTYTGPGYVNILPNVDGDEFEVTVSEPGLYFFTLQGQDILSNTFTDEVALLVLDPIVLDNMLKAKWAGMKAALANGNIDQAVEFIAPYSREVYRHNFTVLQDKLQEIVNDMGEVTLLEILDKYAICDLRMNNSGTIYSYQLRFVKEDDGLWRILDF